jgi:BASS family bile acid:Na+ symporter
LNRFNRFAARSMPLLVLTGITVGIIFDEALGRLIVFVPYIFAFMTFTGTVNASFRELAGVGKKPLPLLLSLAVIHVVMPLFALGVGTLFFSGSPYFISGMVIESSVPCAIASLMWNNIAKGSPVLTLSVVLLDTLGTPFLLPATLSVLLGTNVKIDTTDMMRSLLWMVALPALVSMTLNQLPGKPGKKLAPVLAPYGKIALVLVITINSTRISPFVRSMTPQLYGIAFSILLIAVSGYAAGLLLARATKQPDDITASMTFCCGMRNITAGAVIAAAYFPPQVMFPVMIGTVFQQLTASLYARLLARLRRDKEE